MSEQRAVYKIDTNLLQTLCDDGMMDSEIKMLHGRLRSIKVQLLSLLVEIDKALGDEPSVMTRAERRRR